MLTTTRLVGGTAVDNVLNDNFIRIENEVNSKLTATSDTAWHEIGATGEPAFEHSWVNVDAAVNSTAAFRKDSDGFVHLKGYIKSGTIFNTIFVLPVGYRPALQSMFSTFGINDAGVTFGTISIYGNGNVVSWTAGANPKVDLGNIIFKAEA